MLGDVASRKKNFFQRHPMVLRVNWSEEVPGRLLHMLHVVVEHGVLMVLGRARHSFVIRAKSCFVDRLVWQGVRYPERRCRSVQIRLGPDEALIFLTAYLLLGLLYELLDVCFPTFPILSGTRERTKRFQNESRFHLDRVFDHWKVK
uniref:AlNc14C80G5246 protein n=1 Tax=Albugo laibachii Nc14 TaxID=890382 RepID=F0WF52_9STRA|nr:AlNc14C80G5246 [Albugo laibachii Nc14]|eukprot:CCA19834.1 AlNc14C80G5246 [Albugo laibachii Nc14]